MAKNNENTNENVKKNNHKMFVMAGILLAVAMLSSLVLIIAYHSRSEKVYSNADSASQHLHSINEELLAVNRSVLMIISESGSKEDLAQSIDNSFDNISYFMDQYSSVEERSDRELYRYQQANAFIKAYEKKFNNVRNDLDSLDTALYIQEIHPLQTTASEMLNATIDINVENRESQLAQLQILFNVILLIIFAMLVAGEIGIFIASRYTDKQNEMLRRKEEEFQKVQSMLSVSKRKESGNSKVNNLTGLKNRYALIDELEKGSFGKDFSVAVFNVDNFRYVNETFGYEYGDEYLMLLSEALKERSESYFEVYNYTSNSFCFVFKGAVERAFASAQELHNIMEKNYMLANISIKQTATGCFFNVPSAESTSVDSLLKNAETQIRQAKQQGGSKLVRI